MFLIYIWGSEAKPSKLTVVTMSQQTTPISISMLGREKLQTWV